MIVFLFLEDLPTSAQGCYTDSGWYTDLETLTRFHLLVPDMCIQHCSDQGFLYAGTQVCEQGFCTQELTPVRYNQCEWRENECERTLSTGFFV